MPPCSEALAMYELFMSSESVESNPFQPVWAAANYNTSILAGRKHIIEIKLSTKIIKMPFFLFL